MVIETMNFTSDVEILRDVPESLDKWPERSAQDVWASLLINQGIHDCGAGTPDIGHKDFVPGLLEDYETVMLLAGAGVDGNPNKHWYQPGAGFPLFFGAFLREKYRWMLI